LSQKNRLLRVGLKLLALAALTLWVTSLPEAEPDSILHYRNAAVVLFSIAYAGKILFDTLFYDRYA